MIRARAALGKNIKSVTVLGHNHRMKDFLIADDSPNKIQLMLLMLKHAGWEGDVVLAETTEHAMQLIDEHDFGFAFVDYYMPSKNGPAVIKYLKEKNPSARIALVSSADNADNFAEARAAGAETCICSTHEIDQVEREFSVLLSNWMS